MLAKLHWQNWHKITGSDAARVTGLVLVWQSALTILGFILERVFRPEHAATLVSHTMRWDAGWFVNVINDTYRTLPGEEAFYPFFPLLVKAVHQVSFGLLSIPAAGLVINITASCLAACALYQISNKLLRSQKIAWLTVIIFLMSPTAIFLHQFYSEAVFCALGFWAYLWALQRRWAYMSICLALLSATRITALLVIVLCALEFWRAHDWSFKRVFNKQLLWFLLTPLGFIAYGLYLYARHGDFLRMFHAYHMVSDWSYHIFNPNVLYTFAKTLYRTLLILCGFREVTAGNFINVVLPTLALLILLAASIYCLVKIKRWAVPLGLSGLAACIFFTLNSNVISVHRYVLPVVTIYIAVGYAVKKRPQLFYPCLVMCGLFFMVQMVLFCMFTQDYFIG